MSIDATTIVFAVVAIFVAWRLWSVLGTRTGAERPPMQPPRAARVGGDVVDMPPTPPRRRRRPIAGRASPSRAAPLARGLDAIAAGDPGFDAAAFPRRRARGL